MSKRQTKHIYLCQIQKLKKHTRRKHERDFNKLRQSYVKDGFPLYHGTEHRGMKSFMLSMIQKKP